MGRKKAGLEKWLPVTLSICIFFTVGMVSAGGKNLIANGGFERADVFGPAAAWRDNSGWADVSVKYSRELDKKRDGFVQRIVCDRFNRGAVQFVQSGIKLSAGRTYDIRFRARGEIASPLEVLLRQRGKPYTTYFSRGFRVAAKWNEYHFYATVQVSDPSAYFMFRFTSTGEVFIDDVSVTAVESRPNNRAQSPGNLIPNASFEVGIDRWGVEYREAGGAVYEMPVRAKGLKPEIDSARVKDGKYALKLSTVEHSRFLVTSANIKLTPGQQYSLSMWIYSSASRNLRIGIKSGYLGRGHAYMRQIEVGPGWRRYSLTTDVAVSEGNDYFVVIEGQGPGSVWIDAVQLEEGGMTPFVSRQPIEVGFQKYGQIPVFQAGDKISMPLRVFSRQPVDDCKLVVTGINYYGQRIRLLESRCDASGTGFSNLQVEPPSSESGYYRLVANVVVDGRIMDSSEYSLAIVPAVPDGARALDSPFGGHARFSLPDLDAVAKLGVGWLRMHPPPGTKWSVVENKPGVFRFFDTEIQMAKDAGFHILGSLDRTPRWASTAPAGEPRYWAYPPRDMDDWENYVYKVVKHYRGTIDFWEVWNEPDSDGFLKSAPFSKKRKAQLYVELLKRAHRAAKRANPDVVLVGGVATGHPPTRWLEQIFSLGALAYMDIVSFHFYTDGRPGDALDTPLSEDVARIKELMASYGRVLPVWETESGVMFPETEYGNVEEISPSYAVPGKEAVAYLVRHYVDLLSSGVDKWFYYSMIASNRVDRREATGFFEWDGGPRPLAVAYAVLVSMLGGDAKFSGIYPLKGGGYVTSFQRADAEIKVVWAGKWGSADSSVPVVLTIGEHSGEVSMYDVMGDSRNFTLDGSRLRFRVGREPVYVRVAVP